MGSDESHESNGCYESDEGHEEEGSYESHEGNGCHESHEGHEEEKGHEGHEGHEGRSSCHEGNEGHEEVKIEGFAEKGTQLLPKGQAALVSDRLEQQTRQRTSPSELTYVRL